jgi:hypothetical protein
MTLKFWVWQMSALIGKKLKACEAVYQEKTALALLHQDNSVFDVKYVRCAPVCTGPHEAKLGMRSRLNWGLGSSIWKWFAHLILLNGW